MSKYIDADRLKAEVIRLRKEQPFHDDASFLAYLHGLSKIEDFINSLQQEQSCETCTNDKGCVTCKDGELWEGKEQPSEDLEAEIGKVFFSRRFEDEHGRFSIQLSLEEFSDIAEHFYELRKQSKKDLPEWKRAYAGTHFGEDVVTISPKGKDFPRVVETALTDCLYIPISELMKLARKEE